MNYRYISRHPLSAIKDKSAQIRRRILNQPEPVRRSPVPTEPAPLVVAEIPTEEPMQIDWAAMSPDEQRTFFMENGFLGIAEALSKSELETIHREVDNAGLTGLTDKIWNVPSLPPLIENPKIVGALRHIFGDEVRFFKGSFTDSPPGTITDGKTTRTGYHVDYGGGEPEGDFRNSCASWVNVGIYLTELTRENSPLWVVPGSNRDYGILPCSDLEHMHSQAKILLANAGDAIIFHCMTVHAGGQNFSNEGRRALYFSYRPAWARHVGPVPEWPKEFVESAPPERKRLLQDLNKGLSMELILRMRNLD
ncbi:MAG TPA: phytanoyl-CoA dioxygenase family protein [Pyrinomonadaceae bacterium]|jgi:hypothetical protein|nr:phytanoyl-CoA dioxygenase family protein [Pyrinomonadaceae bacterium]